MDFSLTEEQRRYQAIVREFAQQEVAPHVRDYDREERYPVEIVRKMAPLGFLGGTIPEAYGGPGIDHLTMALGIEEMSRVCIHLRQSCSATHAPVMAAVRVPPSAWITSQSTEICRSPSLGRSTTSMTSWAVW